MESSRLAFNKYSKSKFSQNFDNKLFVLTELTLGILNKIILYNKSVAVLGSVIIQPIPTKHKGMSFVKTHMPSRTTA